MAAKPVGSVQILAQFWEDLDGNVWQNHGGVNGFEKVYTASQVDEIAALKASIEYVNALEVQLQTEINTKANSADIQSNIDIVFADLTTSTTYTNIALANKTNVPFQYKNPTTVVNGFLTFNSGGVATLPFTAVSGFVATIFGTTGVLSSYASKEYVKDPIEISNKFFIKSSPIFTGTEVYPVSSANFYDVGDVYSGWGSPVGIHINFNAIKARIKARATNPITSIYFECRIATSSGTLLASGTKIVSIPTSTSSDIIFELGSTIANVGNEIIWFGYKCNQFCDRYGKNSGINAGYALNGGQTPNSWSPALNRDIWASIGVYEPQYHISENLTSEMVDSIPIIGEIPEIKEKTDKAIELEEVFQGTEIFPEIQASVMDISGGFSGWAVPIGVQHNFTHILGKVKALSNSITSIYFELREVDKSGILLTSGTLSVNIAPNALVDVIYPMGLNIANNGNSQLWFGFKCNQTCGHYANFGISFPFPTYAAAAYTTGGDMSPGVWWYVTNPGTRNGWFKVGTIATLAIPTDDFVEEISKKLPPPVIVDVPEIILPDKIYAIVGDTIQLFYRGIIKAVNPYNYDIVINCTKGAWLPRYFEYTPLIGDIGTVNFTIKVKNSSGTVLATKTCSLITKNVVTSPASNKKVLCLGDSLTNHRIYPPEASRRLIGTGGAPAGKALTNIEFVGRKKAGLVGVEGNSGWNWLNYTTVGRKAFTFTVTAPTVIPIVEAIYKDSNNKEYTMWWDYSTTSLKFIVNDTVSTPPASGILTKVSGVGDATITYSSVVQSAGNPFWNDTTAQLDFTTYVNKWCGGTIDVIYCLLTWNSQTGNRTDFTAFTNEAKILFNHIKAAYPNIKIKLMGVQVSDLRGGVSVEGSPQENTYTDTYGLAVTALNMNKAYQAFANEATYSPFVEFVHVSSQVDSEYNMPYVQKAVNTRNAIVTEPIGTNDVHPNTDGYNQIADVVYRNFVANFCQ